MGTPARAKVAEAELHARGRRPVRRQSSYRDCRPGQQVARPGCSAPPSPTSVPDDRSGYNDSSRIVAGTLPMVLLTSSAPGASSGQAYQAARVRRRRSVASEAGEIVREGRPSPQRDSRSISSSSDQSTSPTKRAAVNDGGWPAARPPTANAATSRGTRCGEQNATSTSGGDQRLVAICTAVHDSCLVAETSPARGRTAVQFLAPTSPARPT